MVDKILSLAKSLIAIPSVKADPKALQEVLTIAKNQLQDFTIEEFESNGSPSMLAYLDKKRPEKFAIILNVHLDVVPGKPEQFIPLEKNGRLYGRGAYDMKTAAAVMILLFRELAEKVQYPLGLQLVTDEETGGEDGTGYQIKKGVQADFVIAGENSNFAIRNEAKGILWLKINIKGITAHGAYPWLGVNAVLKASNFVQDIQKAFSIPEKDAWATTINIAKIESANETFNKVPDNAAVWLDIRYISQDREKVLNQIREILPRNSKIETIADEPPAYTSKDNTYLKKLAAIIEKHTKEKTKIYGANGASDVRFYTNAGSFGVEFGVHGAGQHSDDEWTDVPSLETYYQILKEFLQKTSR